MAVIQDQYGRTFRTLRVSLLNHCNLGCVYCVAGEDIVKAANAGGKKDLLSVPALLEIIGRLHGQLELGTIRLTGGEPLLYPGLTALIRGIHDLGIPAIKLTTNGFLLERLAIPMKEAGMASVNVSLDAVDEDVFYKMSRRHSAERVIRGIDAALEAGLDVKINSVIMRGINDGQILPLLDFAFSRRCSIRYLEVMAMGHLHDQAEKYLFSQKDILSVIAARHSFSSLGRAGAATASYWRTDEGHQFGVIANETEPFCRDCDRLRLDSSGHIYGCLSSNHPIQLDNMEDETKWVEKLQQALLQKQALRFTGSDLSMLYIGG
ncbi:radical SAM protein [Flavitalea sp. BT771]|uniref:GTP 3',8-cyclase MoaA n=1 Tax=Flavitalea sp. BT771 TaxID=3063329 RepID=UPI0026E3743A|nr:radical SAM protein [Flavitalea sp. BT771]MDO6431237.1 radical SAM protein [Flavitalea sp. BT771]MDV6220144.1 radical SAM protein [Flavitalea sp. BT771]